MKEMRRRGGHQRPSIQQCSRTQSKKERKEFKIGPGKSPDAKGRCDKLRKAG